MSDTPSTVRSGHSDGTPLAVRSGHSDGTPSWVTDVERLALGKPVLLLEGKDDVELLRHFFSQHTPGWDLRLHLAAAEGKQRVIAGIAVHRPGWIGVVDRDEWSQDDVHQAVARSPRLNVLSRFCIESYFCHPAELWTALPPNQQARVNNDPQPLAAPIWEQLPDWVAHGAMWRVLRKLHPDTRLPAALERAPVTGEDEIRRILETWHARLAPDQVLGQYRQELWAAQQLSRDEQLQCYVHGKKFYNIIVVQTLDHLFSGQGAGDWFQRFRDSLIQPPDDLKELLDWILNLVPERNSQ